MRLQQKRTIAILWPKKKFESLREEVRHKVFRGRPGEMSPSFRSRRLILSPAAPHSKAYGH
jgi:hypothetical protein